MPNGQSQQRIAEIRRDTKETKIRVALALDGRGEAHIATGLPFLDHMLELFTRHGLFNLEVECRGDLHIDDHHSVEDIAITLGQAFLQALGDKQGIARYGAALVPMDEALCRVVVDLSGRFYLVYEVKTRRQTIGNFSVELAEHFWRSFAEKPVLQFAHRRPAWSQYAPHPGGNFQRGRPARCDRQSSAIQESKEC